MLASKVARTRGGLPRCINNFENRRFATAKEIAYARRINNRFKTKLLLPQGKNNDLKVHGNVVRRIELEYMQYFLLDVEIDNHDMLYILLYKRENQVIHLGLLLDLIINHQTSMDKLWFI